jgi:hypothetical protein
VIVARAVNTAVEAVAVVAAAAAVVTVINFLNQLQRAAFLKQTSLDLFYAKIF